MSDGQGCRCAAHSEAECGCGVDWTPKELIEARAELTRLRAEAVTACERFDADMREKDAEIEGLKQTNSRLNRRCQQAEAAAADAARCIQHLSGGVPWCGGSTGRALLAWHNHKLMKQVEALEQEVAEYLEAVLHEHSYPAAATFPGWLTHSCMADQEYALKRLVEMGVYEVHPGYVNLYRRKQALAADTPTAAHGSSEESGPSHG